MIERSMDDGDYHPNLYTEEVARGRTQYFPAHELVNALMVDSLRVTLTDRASKLCASAIFKAARDTGAFRRSCAERQSDAHGPPTYDVRISNAH